MKKIVVFFLVLLVGVLPVASQTDKDAEIALDNAESVVELGILAATDSTGVSDIGFLTDGTILYAGGELREQNHKAMLKASSYRLAMSPDGETYVIATVKDVIDRYVVWYNAKTNEPLGIETETYTEFFSDLAVGKAFAAAGSTDYPHFFIWDSETGELLHQVEQSAGRVAFNQADVLAVGSTEGVSLWDPATGEQLQELMDENGASQALDFSPDGRYLAGGGGLGLIIWDIETGEEVLRRESASAVKVIDYSPNGQLLVVGLEDGTVALLDALTGEILKDLREQKEPISALTFTPDGRFIILAAGIPISGNKFYLWGLPGTALD